MHKRNFVQLSKFRAMCPHDTYLYIYPYVPPILEMQLSFTFLIFERISIMAKKRTYGITIPKRVYQEILNYLFNTDLTETQKRKRLSKKRADELCADTTVLATSEELYI